LQEFAGWLLTAAKLSAAGRPISKQWAGIRCVLGVRAAVPEHWGFVDFSVNSMEMESGFVLSLDFLYLLRALEERLQEKQLSSPGLEHILLQLDVAQEKEQHLQAEVTHLEDR